jgi:putative holliday junction resolvase
MAVSIGNEFALIERDNKRIQVDQQHLLGRLLGLDVGDARIGVAVSNETGFVVTPHSVIRRKPEPAALAQIMRIAEAESVAGIVVGLPLSLNGEYSDQTRSVAAFVERLAAQTTLPVVTWDERYTTVEAEHILREQGVRRATKSGANRWREQIDAIAATVILQDYLDVHLPPTVPPIAGESS